MIREIKEVCEHYCQDCPTHDETGETELAFCAIGRSATRSPTNRVACAGGCPVTERMSLEWDCYCIKGSGSEQAGMGSTEVPATPPGYRDLPAAWSYGRLHRRSRVSRMSLGRPGYEYGAR
jgi:hypothetical protein